MKKAIKALIFILVSFMVGVGFTALTYHGLWLKITTGLQATTFLGFLLVLVLMFYLTLTIHELAHLIAFRLQGVGIRALYLTIFVFHRTQKGWRFSVKPKLWVLFGGLVVPDLQPIEHEEAYQGVIKRFANALMAAPLATLVFAFLSLVVFIIVLATSTQAFLIGYLFVATLVILFLSALYTWTFFLSNEMFYGDIVAYRKIKQDPVFQLIQINQYTMFSHHDHATTDDFLWQKTIELIGQTPLNHSLFHTMLVNAYLEGIIYQGRAIDEAADARINRLAIHPYLYKEQGLQTAYELVCYHYVKKEACKAILLYQDIERRASRRLPEKLKTYLSKKTAHLIHLADHSVFLADHDNTYIGQYWIFDVLLDPYALLEQMHQPLTFVECSSPVSHLYETPQEDKQKSDI